jgi:hypothetical protein
MADGLYVWLWLALVASLVCGTTAQFTSFPAAPTSASSSSLPQDANDNYMESFCYCDATLNACDANCCCDQSCTEKEKERFTTCSPELSHIPEMTYCIHDSSVVTVCLRRYPFYDIQCQHRQRIPADSVDVHKCVRNDT